jgi:hypothetical protein
MQLWYPIAVLRKADKAGLSFTGAPYRGVLHTTEGKTAAGSFSVYDAKGYWPHFTATFEAGLFKIWQHLPINVGAYALKNVSGGVETNRQNAIQIELVGSCDVANRDWGPQYVENFPPAYLAGIAAWMRWIETQTGVDRVAVPGWKTYPASYGTSNGVRMSSAEWQGWNGWCGHQHVPENLHGDPGLIDIDALLGVTALPPQEEPVTDAEIEAIATRTAGKLDPKIPRLLDHDDPTTPMTGSSHKTIRDELRAFRDDVDARLDALEALLQPPTPAP